MASFEADLVDAALPYLLDVMHMIGLDAETGADVVLVVFEEMRASAAEANTPEVGVEVAMRPGVLTVTVHQHIVGAPASSDIAHPPLPVVTDHGFVRRGYERHSVSTWIVPTLPVDELAHVFPEMDRAALVAALSTESASDSAASSARRDRVPISLEVVVGPDALASIRGKVVRALRLNGVAEGVRDDVELLVSELVANVIRHERASMVNVDVTVDVDRGVTVTVTGVVATEPAVALVHPPGAPDLMSEGGRGLHLLDLLASAWGTRRHDGKTAVWFTVRADNAENAGDDGRINGGRPHMTGSPPDRPRERRGLSARSHAASIAVAAAVAAKAEAVAVVTEAHLRAEPDALAIEAATMTQRAALAAAVMTADAAKTARSARAAAATTAAAAVAEEAARMVRAVQLQADELALAVAAAASDAALAMSDSVVAGGAGDAARVAVQMGATVMSAAAIKSDETALAAALVARAVAAAAAAVSATAAAEDMAIEREVIEAAAAVRAVAALTAQNLAVATRQRAESIAVATRLAGDASERLRDANLQLQRASRHDRSVALALQEAMLTHLPESNELQLAARYLTAAEQDQVGGDWYDALVLPTGSTALVIGDVVGHDIAAAAVMGQLRNLLRGFIWDRNEAPSAVVSRLDRAIRDLHVDTIATMVVVNVEPLSPSDSGARTITWTNAGHPVPILILADGTVSALDDTSDLLLGVLHSTRRRDHTCSVPAGSTLLMYTDGLIETTSQDLDTGQDRLLEAAREHYRLEPGDLLDAVLRDIVGERPADDVAVLAVRFHDQG
jgi:serine phosphatase RsbU (regulator of sigma subunit)/anti-sigma regulatory factor (Ser/Thr protein kinase)